MREDLASCDEAEGIVVGAGQVVAPEGQLYVVVDEGKAAVEQRVERLREVVLACPVSASAGSSARVETDVLQPAACVPDVSRP